MECSFISSAAPTVRIDKMHVGNVAYAYALVAESG